MLYIFYAFTWASYKILYPYEFFLNIFHKCFLSTRMWQENDMKWIIIKINELKDKNA